MTDALAPLRQRFRTRAADDLERLRALRAGGQDSEALRTLVHNMAGAAGIFGYTTLSEAAMAVDDSFFAGQAPDAAQLDLLERRLADVAEAD